jgi:hypothetical protein
VGRRSLLLKARTQRFLSRSLAWLRILPLLTPETRSNRAVMYREPSIRIQRWGT